MINLTKGQKVDINSIKYARVGLGWDTQKYSGQADFDLDASVFMLGSNNKLQRDEDFVFYNNLRHKSGSVIHTGDNRTGDGDGDDEQILIDFTKIPQDIERLTIVVTIHEAAERRQNFGQVDNAYIRLVALQSPNDIKGEEALRFDLTEDYSVETAMEVASIYRHNGIWKFSAVGMGFKDGLEGFVRKFGGNC